MMDTAPLEGEINTEGEDWIKLAKQAYKSSTEYLDENYRKTWERSHYNFRGEHPPGSKYYTANYKHRSKLFRPKTRTSVLKGEAALAAALFSSDDVVAIEAHDRNNPQQVEEAEFWHSILNYRLDQTIPWFRTAVGAYQQSQVWGGVPTKVEWVHEERVVGHEPMVFGGQQLLNDDGTPAMEERVEVVKSEPSLRLLEAENLRIDPAADWTDPINDSPYVIELIPMFLCDVLDYMDLTDPETGEPLWKSYTEDEIAAARHDTDNERSAKPTERNKYNPDRQEVGEFEIVWVHLNFMRVDGEDVYFYTLGTDLLLSDPQPVAENLQWAGVRPYIFGVSTIEAHKLYPAGLAEMVQGLQATANDLVNQRRDNINLVLNKRWKVLRTSNTDLQALQRSIPGGAILTDRLDGAEPDEMNDVTGSAYYEQDRLNADFDDIAGSFSGASVSTNRAMNETVGGMNLLANNSNQVTEFMLRVFVESWAEPVIKRLVLLEQLNEDREVRQRFAKEGFQPTNEGFDVRVNVGFGATNPEHRLLRIVAAIDALAKTSPDGIARLNTDEIVKEVFGAAGYRDGDRFLISEEDIQPQPNPEMQVEQMKMEIEKMKLQLDEQKIALEAQIKREKIQADLELGYAKLRDHDDDGEENRNLKREELKTKRDVAGVDAMNKQNELAFKADTGRQGI